MLLKKMTYPANNTASENMTKLTKPWVRWLFIFYLLFNKGDLCISGIAIHQSGKGSVGAIGEKGLSTLSHLRTYGSIFGSVIDLR